MPYGPTLNQIIRRVFNDPSEALQVLLVGSSGTPIGTGQQSSANSFPVVLSTEQEAILQSIEDNTDGLESAFTLANASLDAIEASVASINTNTDGLEAALATLLSQTDGIESSLSSIDGKLSLNFGVATSAVRVASLLGNASGIADFGSGTQTAQTLRVGLNTTQFNTLASLLDTVNTSIATGPDSWSGGVQVIGGEDIGLGGGSSLSWYMTSGHAGYVNLRDNSGNEIGITSNTLKVRHTDGTNNTPAGDAGARRLFMALSDSSGNTMPPGDTNARAPRFKITDGPGAFGVDATVVTVGGLGFLAVANVDSLTHFQSYTTAGETYAVGLLAHDAADSGGPVKTGFRATTSRLSSVAANDRSDMTGDRQGQLWIDSSEFLIASALVNSGTDSALIAAPGSNLKLSVYNIFVSPNPPAAGVTSTTTVSGVEFRFASGTYRYQTMWKLNTGTTDLSATPVDIPIQHGHWDGGSNEALNVHTLTPIGTNMTGAFYVTVAYRIMPT